MKMPLGGFPSSPMYSSCNSSSPDACSQGPTRIPLATHPHRLHVPKGQPEIPLVACPTDCLFPRAARNSYYNSFSLASCADLHVLTEALLDKYLGLPTIVGVDCSDCFQYLIEQVFNIIKDWKGKTLSSCGKDILMKAMAQAISSDAMSVFCLPKGICKVISDEILGFWWGDNETKKRMHWISWWKMCILKKTGGM